MCDHPIPGSESPIAAFSYKFFFFYKCDHPIPGSGNLIVAFLSPIVAFFCNLWNLSLKLEFHVDFFPH